MNALARLSLAGDSFEFKKRQSARTGIENKWFALAGRVVAVKAETDGDLQIALQDATGNKPGIVIVEFSQMMGGQGG